MNPNPQAAQNYLKMRVMTATPEQLQMMLYDGAIRFCEQARAALVASDFEKSYQMISRVQKILTEMSGSLKHDVYPELCGKLAALYNFAYRKLIEANIDHKIDSLDEALNVLRFQRETWAMLLDQLGKNKAANAAAKINMPDPDARMEAQIRISA
jgi:flagellar protein FliS